jgi:hypothetical protein
MQPENIPRALPLALVIYGHDVRIVSDPAMLGGELVVLDRASQGARFDAQRTPRSAELAGSGVLRYDQLTIDTASRRVMYGPMCLELRRREYALIAHLARDPERIWTRHGCCATCGATTPTARPEPSIAMRRAYAPSLPPPGRSDGSSRRGASATGSRRRRPLKTAVSRPMTKGVLRLVQSCRMAVRPCGRASSRRKPPSDTSGSISRLASLRGGNRR